MRGKIQHFFLFTSLEGLLSLLFLLAIPSDAKNALLLGFSLERLALAAVILLPAGLLGWGELVTLGYLPGEAKIIALFHAINRRDRAPVLLLTLFCFVLVLGVYFAYSWAFTRLGDRFGAVYLRLAPIVFYAMAINAHLLVLFFASAPREKRLPWIASILAPFAALLIQLPFLPDILLPAFITLLPLISLGIGLIVFLLFSLRPRPITSPVLGWLAVVCLFGVLAYFYVQAASDHARTVNTVLSRDDQGAFLNFARDVYESGFRYTGDRNRMPVYPFLQAAFYNPAMSSEAFFQQGKQLNILLSLVCLGGLFLVFKRFLPLHDAVNLTLIAAFSIFIFKSAYFQSELLFYTLNFFGFVLMALLLVRPGVMLALLTGAALGLAHLTKASVLPGLILFLGVALLKPFLARLHSPGPAVWFRSLKRSILVNAAGAGLVGVAFLGVVFPYILESKQVFGRYFYNVNSTFYMWYDSWEQAKAGTRAHGDRVGWPDLPPDEIPGPAKYFREHTPLQVLARLGDGLAFQFSVLRDQYGVFNYPVLLSSFLVAFIALDFRRFRDLLGEHLPLVLFGVLYFSLYLLLYAWYKPISDGPRFTFTLIIPFLFAALVAIHHLAGPGKSHEGVPPPWGRFRRASLASSVITIFLLVDIYFVLTSLIKSGYFGG